MTLNQKHKTLQLIEQHPEFIKTQKDFLAFLEECLVKHKSFNAISEAIFWHFESNYPPHMFDATTLNMADLATQIAANFDNNISDSETQNIHE